LVVTTTSVLWNSCEIQIWCITLLLGLVKK
jgi:hypothetical protein